MAESTEEAGVRFQGLDGWPTAEILTALWNGQMQAVAACLPALPALGTAVDAAARRLSGRNGRLVYVGAGSSGGIAAIDGLELGGTFDWPDARLAVVLAGGLDLNRGLSAGAEDDAGAGREAALERRVGRGDVVVGVSAGGRSPYTVAFLEAAREAGALTVAVSSVADSPLVRAAEHAVVIATGPEVLAGSTRLGAGTAQKVVLNLFSTALMTALGAVHDNLMVNVRPENAKLRARCASIVARIAGVDAVRAGAALARHGDVKRAVLGLAGVAESDINDRLAEAGGNLRRALNGVRRREGASA